MQWIPLNAVDGMPEAEGARQLSDAFPQVAWGGALFSHGNGQLTYCEYLRSKGGEMKWRRGTSPNYKSSHFPEKANTGLLLEEVICPTFLENVLSHFPENCCC